MIRFVRALLLLFLLLLTGVHTPAIAQESVHERQVWVFYLGFWAGEPTWDWNETILVDYPLMGRYNAKLPQVAAVQIRQAQRAGIDAFIVNWFGVADPITTTPALNNLLDRAAEQGFSIGAAVDLFDSRFHRTPEAVIESLDWLLRERVNHPAYLRYQGRPVIFFAFQHMANFSTATWQRIRETVDPNHETLWLAEGLNACCLYDGAMDGMYAFNMAWANGNPDFYVAERNLITERDGLYIPGVSPGWDEDAIARITNRPNPTSPRSRSSGDFLREAWSGALAAESDVILVVSWNEFIENSHIEPSIRYGSQALDILERLIIEWRGFSNMIPEILPPLPTAYVVQARQRVPVYTAPDRSARIRGFLRVNQSYPLLDEESGLYAIEFFGGVGYVASEDIRLVGVYTPLPCYQVSLIGICAARR